MLRKSRLSAAVAFALASAAVVATPVLAEEGQNVEKLQKIKVTGSRISRVDVEGATPVVAISKAKIEQSGQQTVADYLKQASYNSFGSISPLPAAQPNPRPPSACAALAPSAPWCCSTASGSPALPPWG